MMNKHNKTLTESELPATFRAAYELATQKQIPDSHRPGSQKSYVLRRCTSCNREEWVAVNHVRSALRLGQLTATCQECNFKRPRPDLVLWRKYLTESELPDYLRGAFDLDSQQADGVRGLVIARTCRECEKAETVPVASLRQKLKRGTATGRCKACYSRLSHHDKKQASE